MDVRESLQDAVEPFRVRIQGHGLVRTGRDVDFELRVKDLTKSVEIPGIPDPDVFFHQGLVLLLECSDVFQGIQLRQGILILAAAQEEQEDGQEQQ